MKRLKVTTAMNKIDKIIDSTQYQYCRIELVDNDRSYIVEKNRRHQAGFKVGDSNE